RNSLRLIHQVLAHLDANFTSAPEYLVLHEDQPTNDFASLLDTLNSPESYIHSRPNVYTGVISKSFYERLVPSASIDIFVSYISTHWLSKVPTPLPGSLVFINDPDCKANASPEVVDAWRKGAHGDLVTFLRHRATELVDNGSLCLTLVSDDEKKLSLEYIGVVTRSLEDMVASGLLSSGSLARMAMSFYLRTTEEFLAAAADVPELEVHEYQHVPLNCRFDTVSGAVNFLSSMMKPCLESSMTEEEKADPRVRDGFIECMTNQFGKVVGDRTTPFYQDFTISGAMEDDGAYNKAAICQMDLVDKTTESPKVNYCIVDLGASQGRNSLQLIRHVLKHLEPSLPNEKRHEFFITPPTTAASVDIFVSYISTHWLSKIPVPLPGPSVFCHDPECQANVSLNVLDAWRRVAHEDLVGFLRLRGTELVDHGALCMTFASNNGDLDVLEYFSVVNGGLRDMVAMGALSSGSLDRIEVSSVLRTTEEFMEAAAEVRELELHEFQHVTLDFNFDNASGAVDFFAS
ncbi:unnamed protein product, partial [Aphanomyces euteiches]